MKTNIQTTDWAQSTRVHATTQSRVQQPVVLLLLILSLISGSTAETVTVRPREIDDVLINPGIGFTTFQRFNGDSLNAGLKWTEGYPIDYQQFSGSLTNRDHPLTSIAYFRIYWKFMEPEQWKTQLGDARHGACRGPEPWTNADAADRSLWDGKGQ